MNDLIVGFGLVLVIEGLLWAVSPSLGLRLLATAAEASERALRLSGSIAVAAGVVIVWLVRG